MKRHPALLAAILGWLMVLMQGTPCEAQHDYVRVYAREAFGPYQDRTAIGPYANLGQQLAFPNSVPTYQMTYTASDGTRVRGDPRGGKAIFSLTMVPFTAFQPIRKGIFLGPLAARPILNADAFRSSGLMAPGLSPGGRFDPVTDVISEDPIAAIALVSLQPPPFGTQTVARDLSAGPTDGFGGFAPMTPGSRAWGALVSAFNARYREDEVLFVGPWQAAGREGLATRLVEESSSRGASILMSSGPGRSPSSGAYLRHSGANVEFMGRSPASTRVLRGYEHVGYVDEQVTARQAGPYSRHAGALVVFVGGRQSPRANIDALGRFHRPPRAIGTLPGADNFEEPTSGPIIARAGAEVLYTGPYGTAARNVTPAMSARAGVPAEPRLDLLDEEEPVQSGPVYARAGAPVVYVGQQHRANYQRRAERTTGTTAASPEPESDAWNASRPPTAQVRQAGADVRYDGGWRPVAGADRSRAAERTSGTPDSGLDQTYEPVSQAPLHRSAGANVIYDGGWGGGLAWNRSRGERGVRAWDAGQDWNGDLGLASAVPIRQRAGAQVDYEGGWTSGGIRDRGRGLGDYSSSTGLADSGWDENQALASLSPLRRRAGANVIYNRSWSERWAHRFREPRTLMAKYGQPNTNWEDVPEGDTDFARQPLRLQAGANVLYTGNTWQDFYAPTRSRSSASQYRYASAAGRYDSFAEPDLRTGASYARPLVQPAGANLVPGDSRRSEAPQVVQPMRRLGDNGYYSQDYLAGLDVLGTSQTAAAGGQGGIYDRLAANDWVRRQESELPSRLLQEGRFPTTMRPAGGGLGYGANVIDSATGRLLNEGLSGVLEAEPVEGILSGGRVRGPVLVAQLGGGGASMGLGALSNRSNLQLGALGGSVISPYMNMMRGGSPALNYFGIVQPLQMLNNEVSNLNNQLGGGGGQNVGVPTAPRGYFMNFGHYYPGLGTNGSGGRRPGAGGGR